MTERISFKDITPSFQGGGIGEQITRSLQEQGILSPNRASRADIIQFLTRHPLGLKKEDLVRFESLKPFLTNRTSDQ